MELTKKQEALDDAIQQLNYWKDHGDGTITNEQVETLSVIRMSLEDKENIRLMLMASPGEEIYVEDLGECVIISDSIKQVKYKEIYKVDLVIEADGSMKWLSVNPNYDEGNIHIKTVNIQKKDQKKDELSIYDKILKVIIEEIENREGELQYVGGKSFDEIKARLLEDFPSLQNNSVKNGKKMSRIKN